MGPLDEVTWTMMTPTLTEAMFLWELRLTKVHLKMLVFDSRHSRIIRW